MKIYYKKSLALFLIAFIFPVWVYAFVIGQNMSDLLGQYISNDGGANNYTSQDQNDGPNKFGLSLDGTNMVIDTLNHRLFITDPSNHRVIVHQLNASDQPIDNEADFVLGQPDFYSANSATSATGINFPLGLAIDVTGQRLFVGNYGLHRIMVFDISTITNGEAAINVLGQTNFTTGSFGTTASKLREPRGMKYDQTTGRLFVVDSYNDRVLVFDATTITDGEAAVNVIGQVNFTSAVSAHDQDNFNTPYDLDLDTATGRLFVADFDVTNNNRILVFDVNSITDGEPAVNVLGKSTFTEANGIASQSNLTSAMSVVFDSNNNRLFVGNNGRILVFDVTTIVNGENAINVLGQVNFTTTTQNLTQSGVGAIRGMAYSTAGNYLYALDQPYNRIMVFDVAAITNGENAVDLFGQTANNDGVTDEYTWGYNNDAPGLYGLVFVNNTGPNSLAYDKVNHRLFVPDRGNGRLLIYNLNASNDLVDKTPDFVLGQSTFYRNTSANNTTGLNGPRAAAYDDVNNRLFVVDGLNNRVLVYDAAAFTNGEAAINVIGQPNFTTTSAGVTQAKLSVPAGITYSTTTQMLYVADSSNNRVMIFDLSGGITNGMNASKVLGQSIFTTSAFGTTATTLRTPFDVKVDNVNNRLFVADHTNNRVLVYDVSTITDGEAAVNVLGQPALNLSVAANTASGFTGVRGLEYDPIKKRLYVGNSGRTSVFNVSTITDGMSAFEVLGSNSLTSGGLGTVVNGMVQASGMVYIPESGKLFVVDGSTSRLAVFDDLLSVEFNKSVATTTNESTLGSSYPLLLFVDGFASTTQTVTISRSSGSASFGEYTNATHTISIPPGIYDGTTSTAITINPPTLVDDGSVESTETVIFSISTSTYGVYSSDANANQTNQSTFTLNILDDDVAGVVNVEFSTSTASSTNEATANNFPTLLVNGTLAATSTVQVAITGGTAVGSGIDFTLATTTTITIPPGSYNGLAGTALNLTTPTLINDFIFEGNETIILTLQSPSGVNIANANGDSATTTIHTYTITDDDVIGVTVNTTDSLTGEDLSTGSFSLVLTSQPTSSVTIPLSTSDATEGTVPVSVTFTTGNWNVPQIVTVTGVDDVVSDGAVAYTIITGDITSADTNYNALDGTTVTDPSFTNQDNDAPGVIITPSSFSTTEAGGTITLQFTLLSQPGGGADVTIPISSSDITEGTVSAGSITILNANWNNGAANTITVTGVDDILSDGNISYNIVTGDPTSADVTYNALVASDVADITLSNTDNEVAGFSIVESGGSTSVTEPSTTDTFTVVLNTQPTNDVVINLVSADTTEGNISPLSLTFTNANWNTPQTVTLTAVDDLVVDGTQTYNITLSVNVGSSDVTFAGIVAQNISATTLDNDVADSTAPSISSGTINGSTLVLTYNENLVGTSTPLTSDFVVYVNGVPTTLSTVVISGTTVTITLVTPVINGEVVTLDYTAGLTPLMDAPNNQSSNLSGYAITNNTAAAVAPSTGSSGGSIVAPVSQYYTGTTYVQSTIYQQQSKLLDLIGGEEPNVPAEFSNYVCKRYMKEYILPGQKNNPVEVKKLQSFLNETQGEKLLVDGTYDNDDIEAVKRFQGKYLDQIMSPWGLEEPTGRVLRTTTAKINLLMCSTQKGCPYFSSYLKEGDTSLDSVKVQDFLNVIFAPISGYPTNGLELSKEFNSKTKTTVKDFQTVYKEIVLKPWGLTSATGWWYKTTRHAANKLMNCAEGEIVLDNGAKVE